MQNANALGVIARFGLLVVENRQSFTHESLSWGSLSFLGISFSVCRLFARFCFLEPWEHL